MPVLGLPDEAVADEQSFFFLRRIMRGAGLFVGKEVDDG